MTKISVASRHRVVILHEQGHSRAEIARQTGVSRRGVQAILMKQQKTGKVEDRKRSGRSWELTKNDETSEDNIPKKQKKDKLGSCCRTRPNVGETSTLINCKITQKEWTKWQGSS